MQSPDYCRSDHHPMYLRLKTYLVLLSQHWEITVLGVRLPVRRGVGPGQDLPAVRAGEDAPHQGQRGGGAVTVKAVGVNLV